jgi:hypothetical protein
MSVQITIAGTIIDFPTSGTSPDYSQAIVEFAQAVESALQSVAGTYDVSQQSVALDSYNPGSNVDIPNLSFPTSNVRATFIKYSVYRVTNTTNAAESGNMLAVYNTALGTWELQQERVGNASISFTIANNGQVSFSTTAFGGTGHSGTLIYEARSLST